MNDAIIINADNTPESPKTDGWHVLPDGTGAEYYFNGHAIRVASWEVIVRSLNLEEYTVRRLRDEQIDGSDNRLTDFWAKAQELADKAGHCRVFDEMAEALGGPGRERDYTVTFTYTGTFTVSARSEDEAVEFAREGIQDHYNIGDLSEDDYTVDED